MQPTFFLLWLQIPTTLEVWQSPTGFRKLQNLLDARLHIFIFIFIFFYVNKVGLEKLQFKGYNKLFLYFCCNSLARLHTLHFTRINKLWLLYYLRWTKTSTHWDALWQDEKRRFVLEMGDLILIVCSIYNDQDLDRQPDWHSGSQNCPNDLKKCSVSIKLIETSVYKSLWGD